MKYKILADFTDKYDYSINYKANDIVKFTKKRAEEILTIGNLIEKFKETEDSSQENENQDDSNQSLDDENQENENQDNDNE